MYLFGKFAQHNILDKIDQFNFFFGHVFNVIFFSRQLFSNFVVQFLLYFQLHLTYFFYCFWISVSVSHVWSRFTIQKLCFFKFSLSFQISFLLFQCLVINVQIQPLLPKFFIAHISPHFTQFKGRGVLIEVLGSTVSLCWFSFPVPRIVFKIFFWP